MKIIPSYLSLYFQFSLALCIKYACILIVRMGALFSACCVGSWVRFWWLVAGSAPMGLWGGCWVRPWVWGVGVGSGRGFVVWVLGQVVGLGCGFGGWLRVVHPWVCGVRVLGQVVGLGCGFGGWLRVVHPWVCGVRVWVWGQAVGSGRGVRPLG